MQRKDGFIDICSLLNMVEKDYSKPSFFSELVNKLYITNGVEVLRCSPPLKLVFSFYYNGEKYFFKYDKKANPYMELIAEEVCCELGINSVSYDLASLGNLQGNISKNFEIEDALYITGHDLLKGSKIHTNNGNSDIVVIDAQSEDEDVTVAKYNSLESIWAALEICYPKKVVQSIMPKIVMMFIIDFILGIYERHDKNWKIVEYPDGTVDLGPIYDNALAMLDNLPAGMASSINNPISWASPKASWQDGLNAFISQSSSEYITLLEDSLWVLSKDNFLNIAQIIRKKTGVAMPMSTKGEYIERFQFYLDSINTILIANRGR